MFFPNYFVGGATGLQKLSIRLLMFFFPTVTVAKPERPPSWYKPFTWVCMRESIESLARRKIAFYPVGHQRTHGLPRKNRVGNEKCYFIQYRLRERSGGKYIRHDSSLVSCTGYSRTLNCFAHDRFYAHEFIYEVFQSQPPWSELSIKISILI